MAIWQASGPKGRNVLVEGPAGDEAAVRELLAGKGADRDEAWLSQDTAHVSEVRQTGRARILYELPADAPSEKKAAKS